MRKLAVMLFLVACGDDSARHTPDAAKHVDGAPDSPADAAVNPVTIAAVLDGQPVMGVHVYFQNADSSVVLATTTDATGTASAVMAAGGYVTAVNPYTLPALGGVQTDELDTFVGVKPGDHLLLKKSLVTTAETVNMSGPGEVGLSNYAGYSPCNTAGTALQPPLGIVALAPGPVTGPMTLQNCGATTDFLIVAADGSGAMQYVYAPNTAIADGSNVDISSLTYGPATSRTLSWTNVPNAQSLSYQDFVIDPMGPILLLGNEMPAGSAASSTFDVPLFTGASDALETAFGFTTFAQQYTVDWGQLGSAATIDMSTRVLFNFDGNPAFDPATKGASMTYDNSSGVAPDFAMFSITASRTTPRNWKWYVTAPHAASITLPTVPTDIFDFNIAGSDSYTVDSWVEGMVPGGYDAVRAFVLSARPYLDRNSAFLPQTIVFGGSGAASFVQYHPPLALTSRHFLRHRTR